MAGRGGRQANSTVAKYSGLPHYGYVMIDAPLPEHVAKWACRRTPGVWLTWACITCRGEWTMDGSYLTGRCSRCGTARPTETTRTTTPTIQ